MAAIASLPFVITQCLSLLPDFVSSRLFTFGRSGERHRSMRSDRRKNLLTVLNALVRACSLQHEGLFCHISGIWARPLTLAEIASYCFGICEKTVTRCINDLKDLGLIETKQIKRKNPETGLFEVSIGIRRFTPKFWEELGLSELFEKSCKWAKENGKRRLVMPFKKISLKAKKTATAVKDTAKSVLASLRSAYTKCQEQKILTDLHQRK